MTMVEIVVDNLELHRVVVDELYSHQSLREYQLVSEILDTSRTDKIYHYHCRRVHNRWVQNILHRN